MNDGKRRLGFLDRIYAADDGGANGAFGQSLMHLPALDMWQHYTRQNTSGEAIGHRSLWEI